LPGQRKVLYFLGAGASRGAGASTGVQGGGRIPIPVQEDFWETLLRFQEPRSVKIIQGFLFRYFAGYRRIPARLSWRARIEILRPIAVEEVFTFLSERARAPSTSPALRTYVEQVWDVLVLAIGETFRRFRPTTGTRSVYRALRKNHIRGDDAVVSFNYDTVFERSLPKSSTWHYFGLAGAGSSGLKVYKPHGSVDWDLQGGRIVTAEIPEAPVVVAPTHLKFVAGTTQDLAVGGTGTSQPRAGYLDLSSDLRRIWADMEGQMRRAKALVFIGYSFPPADLYFASILRSVLAAREAKPYVVIVNPDAVSIAERLRSRFALDSVLRFFDLDQFVQVPRSQMLRRLKGG
jgi:hypothetical protein